MGEQDSCLTNSLGSSTTNRLDSRAANRSSSSLGNHLGKQMDCSSMLDRVVSTTAAGVELRLPLTQQVGGTRRRVTEEASRKAKATTQRQSNLLHSSPSGRMRQTSKYRPKKRSKEDSTCTGTLANSNIYRFPHFIVALIKSLLHYLLIYNTH